VATSLKRNPATGELQAADARAVGFSLLFALNQIIDG
jgi:hypothetical protein